MQIKQTQKAFLFVLECKSKHNEEIERVQTSYIEKMGRHEKMFNSIQEKFIIAEKKLHVIEVSAKVREGCVINGFSMLKIHRGF